MDSFPGRHPRSGRSHPLRHGDSLTHSDRTATVTRLIKPPYHGAVRALYAQ
ncbi:protein of unknown function [Stenotrophomonas maltophilia]|nr:protein of unknown function [Stenotrophomonas maltophilia]